MAVSQDDKGLKKWASTQSFNLLRVCLERRLAARQAPARLRKVFSCFEDIDRLSPGVSKRVGVDAIQV